MNFLGKIFVVANLIMSIVLMSLSVFLYATHTNWRDEIERQDATGGKSVGYKKQLEALNTEKSNLTIRRNKLIAQIELERSAHRHSLQVLEQKFQEELAEYNHNKQTLEDQTGVNKSLADGVKLAQDTLSKFTEETSKLRKEVREIQQERDDKFSQVVALTDSLHQKLGNLISFKERNEQLTQQIARYIRFVKNSGLDIHKDFVAQIDGVVTAVGNGDMIEVSIGSDDGLKIGHTVEVYRGSKYLGRAEIHKTSPDRSVGKIIPKYREGLIKRGDRIATRLKS